MGDQLGAILSDPEVIPRQADAPKKEVPPPSPPGIGAGDLEMVKAFTGFARGAEIDKDQRALLKALSPHVSREKTAKLERAMHAAKLAQQASSLMESGALKKLTGV